MIQKFLFILLIINGHLFGQGPKSFVCVLGICQDGGYPHLGCNRSCCKLAWKDTHKRKYIVSLAIVDPVEKKWWLVEATPDIREQLHFFQKLTNGNYSYLPDGIFITHAHIGHYTGLMQLGREVFNSNKTPVYVMPKMKQFLETNGPWSQLVNLKNIELNELMADRLLILNTSFKIRAFMVPHRDEYSETAGFKIILNEKNYLFIPDIDKWEKWNKDIVNLVQEADIAFIDATFYDTSELPNRKIEDVPHPFVFETMQLFDLENAETKSKIKFIHFNHTNPLIWSKEKQKKVLERGFGIAEQFKNY